MTELIHRLIQSDDNCFVGDYYDPTHRTDEIYTCLDCLEAGIRAAERERIIKLLEPLAIHAPNCFYEQHNWPEDCDANAVRKVIALIKGDN